MWISCPKNLCGPPTWHRRGQLQRGVTLALLVIAIPSCVTTPPPTVPAIAQHLQQIHKVGLRVSDQPLLVRYGREGTPEPGGDLRFLLGLVLGPVLLMVPSLIQRHGEAVEDEKQTARVQGQVASLRPRDILAQYFVQEMQASRFTVFRVADDSAVDADAVILLEITDLALRGRIPGGPVAPHLTVTGRMTDGHRRIIWQRSLLLTGESELLLTTYTEDAGRLLIIAVDGLLRRASRRLANDLLFAN